jgi:hypothetical protein
MPLGCPRCGTQNPDGNLYCQACGTPLGAPAGVTTGVIPGPPPGMAPPMAAPGGYQSPYYAPTGPPVPVNRTPWMLIIAGVVALTLVMGGVGTALALMANHGSQNQSGGGIADVPSPTPGVTPSPVASPTAPISATGLVSNDGFSVNLPSGWTVDSKDNESMTLTDPNGEGAVTIASGVSIPTQTAQQNKDAIVGALQAKYPDTRECPNTSPTGGTFNGVSGISFTLCFTLTEGSNSAPAAAAMFVGANKSGTVFYVAIVLTVQDHLQSYIATCRPLLASVQWKLS